MNRRQCCKLCCPSPSLPGIFGGGARSSGRSISADVPPGVGGVSGPGGVAVLAPPPSPVTKCATSHGESLVPHPLDLNESLGEMMKSCFFLF